MKTFKLKFMFSGLLTTMILALVMTSCEQNLSVENTAEEMVNELLKGKTVVLPHGFVDKTAEIKYLNGLNEEQFIKLEENYRITMFLQEEGAYGEVVALLTTGGHIADVNLTEHLNRNQLERLESYEVIEVNDRGTSCSIESGYCYTRKTCCWNDAGTLYCWTAWEYPFC